MRGLLLALALGAEWSPADTHREVAFQGLLLADVAATVAAQRQGARENNPMLGRHPSVRTVALWGAGASLAHLGISLVLPGEWRVAWQYGSIGVELMAVGQTGLCLAGVF